MEIDFGCVLNALPAMVWTALSDGHIDFVNRRLSEYASLDLGQDRVWVWEDLVEPNDLPKLLQRWRSSLLSGEPGELEARLRRFDGQYRRFIIRYAPIYSDAGQLAKWCGVCTDVEDLPQAEEREVPTPAQDVGYFSRQEHLAKGVVARVAQRTRDDGVRTEEALRESERRFRLIVDSIPGMVAVFTAEGELKLVNSQLLAFYGKTFEELRDWGTNEIVHPEDLPRAVEAFTRSLASGDPFDIEVRSRRFDGGYRWLQSRGLPLKDTEGRIVSWYNLIFDIDERKRAEEALEASERKLKLTINAMPALAWSAGIDGAAEFFNQHYLDYVGFSAEQAQGWGWTIAVHPDDMGRLTAAWQEILASGRSGETEARLRRHDGKYRWFLFRASPQGDALGKITRWYGINTDIEERKQAEEKLRRSEAFLAEGQHLARMGNLYWNVGTAEIIWSEPLFRIFAFEPGSAVTLERIATRVHPEDMSLMGDMIERAQRGEVHFEYQHRIIMPDQSVKHLHLIAHRVRNQSGEMEYIGAVLDITQRRVSEEALETARSELARVTRVTTLGAMVASIAHEVSQPLSGIITNAGTCLRMLDVDPPYIEGAREPARRIIRDGNRAAEVVTRLRALFGRKPFAPELLDVNEATREIIALSSSDLQRSGVLLQTELADDLPQVIGDRVQIQQVILNLLRNASDAMIGIDDRPRELLVRTELEDGEHVRVSVRDVGVGIHPEGMERLFKPFQTTKSAGMGIGLFVSRSIIDRHHGHLWAEPNDGPGVTFAFSIPRSSRDTPAIEN